MKFIVKKIAKKIPKLKKPILVEGLPGIGNVGKISADFLVEEIKSEKLFEIYSSSFPHSVFINENGTVELPKVELHLIRKKRDIIVLSGDIQPIKEKTSYDFAEKIISICSKLGCKEVITLGGIGMHGEIKKHNIFITGTDEKIIKEYRDKSSNIKIEGNSAATILGAAGLLLGVGAVNGWKGVSLLVETFADPFHIGINEAYSLLKILDKLLGLEIDLKKLAIEIKKAERAEKIESSKILKKLKKLSGDSDTSYIG